MTVVGRTKLDHPALGTTGGSALHSSIETMWTAVSDHLGSRFKAYSSQSNSTTVTYEHNFGKDLSTLQVHIYTGSAGSLTKVKDPTAAGWVIAATSGFLKTKVDVTTPSTGGPHTFVVSVHEDEKSLDNLSITGTAGQGYVDVTTQSSAPSSPASGDVRIYSKTDGKLYKKDSSGNEAAVGAGSGSGGVNYLVDWYDATKAVGTVSTVAVGGNVTVSGSFPAVTSAWYADTTSGSAAIASSSDNTLRSTANYLTAVSGVSTSGATFVQSPVFNIDGKDLGTALTVQFDVSGNTTDNDWDVVAVRYNSSGVYQELIPIAGNVSTMTGTPSAKLPLGVKTFNGFFITGSTASDVYAIRWRRRNGSVAIRLDSLVVGPQQVLQGAIVTDWQSDSPTVIGFGAESSKSVFYRRVGNVMEIRGEFVGGTPTAVTASVALPAGLTVDSTTITTTSPVGYHFTSKGTADKKGGAVLVAASGTVLNFSNFGTFGTTATNPLAAALGTAVCESGDQFCFYASVPISQWQSNTQQAARAVEEYASNSDTSNTTNTSAFANGVSGSQILSTTPSTNSIAKRVRFQTPILPTDVLIVEVSSDRVKWVPLPASPAGTIIENGRFDGTNFIGIGFPEFISSTDVNYTFGKYASGTSTAWSGTHYWRVRKVSSGAAVGFPVGARNVIGDTTGTTVPAGYIGEKITFTSASVTGGSGSWVANSTSMGSLTTGVWLVCMTGEPAPASACNHARWLMSTNSTNDGTGSIITCGTTYTANANAANQPMVFMQAVYVAAATTPLYAKGFGEDATVVIVVSGYAVRIA